MSVQYQYIIIVSSSHTANELATFDAAAQNTMKYATWNHNNTKYILKCSTHTPTCFASHTRYTATELYNSITTKVEWKGSVTSSAQTNDSDWDSSHDGW